jgi:ribulose kinase
MSVRTIKLSSKAIDVYQIWDIDDCLTTFLFPNQQSSTDIWHAICAAVKSACALANVASKEVKGLGFAATCSLGV